MATIRDSFHNPQPGDREGRPQPPACPSTDKSCGRLECDPARGECMLRARPAPLDLSDLQPKLDAIIYDTGMMTGGKVDSVLLLIATEVKRAMDKWPPTTDSTHHHMGVLREEVDEMWDEVKADNIRLAREECLQVAAMAIRFILEADLAPNRRKPRETRDECAGRILDSVERATSRPSGGRDDLGH